METKINEDNTQIISSSLQFSKLTKFHRFQDLPVELRLKIWRLASNSPRNIHIESELTVAVPSVLQANFESRTEALKSYSLIRIPRTPRGQPFNRVVVGRHPEYVNLARDTICFFPPATEHDGFYSRVTQEDLGGILKQCEDWNVQHFATDLTLWRKLLWTLAYYRSQEAISETGWDAKQPEFSRFSPIKTVTLSRPFEGSKKDINHKRLVRFKHDRDRLSKGQIRQMAAMAVCGYNELNPENPWEWQGTIRVGSVELDVQRKRFDCRL